MILTRWGLLHVVIVEVKDNCANLQRSGLRQSPGRSPWTDLKNLRFTPVGQCYNMVI